MKNPPFRSPREKVGGLYHFGRMLDKIRLSLQGELPDEYKPHFGLSLGKEDGLENRADLVTTFDTIDFREGRLKIE